MISAWDIVGVFGFGFLVGVMLQWVLDGYRIDREAAQNADSIRFPAALPDQQEPIDHEIGDVEVPAFLRRQAD